jgi:hypothetical protein
MIVKLMGFEAFTLAVFSTLHLTGVLTVGSASPSHGAGFAEALICVALVAGAWALARRANREGPGARAHLTRDPGQSRLGCFRSRLDVR